MKDFLGGEVRRRVTNTRKQVLDIKGKLWIKAVYKSSNGRKVTILSDSVAMNLKSKINQKRAVFNALTKGIKLSVVEYGFDSSTKVDKIINWGIKYGNKDVTVKRYSVKGKYRTGVWVKGQKGIVTSEKYSSKSTSNIQQLADNQGLTNNIWNNDY